MLLEGRMKMVSFFRAGEALVSRVVQVVLSLVIGFFFSFVVGCFVFFLFVYFLPCSELVDLSGHHIAYSTSAQ